MKIQAAETNTFSKLTLFQRGLYLGLLNLQEENHLPDNLAGISNRLDLLVTDRSHVQKALGVLVALGLVEY